MSHSVARAVFKLNSSFEIPLIGLGTYQIHGDDIYTSINNALRAGYRHIDTASGYRNEEQIGDALQNLLPKYGLTREGIFITSKLVPRARQTEDQVIDTVKRSLKDLQTNYVDLYLIHWPGVMGIPVESAENAEYRKQTWRALVKCKQQGLVRSLGVSNYIVRHLTELLAYCNEVDASIKPSVNQVEFHPHYKQTDLLEFCRTTGIFFQAYSSLGTSTSSSLREDPTVKTLAVKLGKSPSQILLRWAVQQGVGILPKARSQQHVEEDIALDFEIPQDGMEALDQITGPKYAWNPEPVV